MSEVPVTVGSVAQCTVNQAAMWSDFFSGRQGCDEPMAKYFQRFMQQAFNCDFLCLQCNNDLSDDIILRKDIMGLNKQTEKKRLISIVTCTLMWTSFMLSAFHTEQQRGTPCVLGALAMAMICGMRRTNLSWLACQMYEHSAVAVTSHPPCSNCGGQNVTGKSLPPAKDATCHHCQKK